MYIELLLKIRAGADHDGLLALLRARGFDPLPMTAGVLLASERDALRALLPGLTGSETGELPIPGELRSAVESIRVFKPRSFHSP
jgi:hypothetical protein